MKQHRLLLDDVDLDSVGTSGRIEYRQLMARADVVRKIRQICRQKDLLLGGIDHMQLTDHVEVLLVQTA